MRNKIKSHLKYFGIFLLFIFGAILLQAQSKTDSLFNVLNTEKLNDSEQSILYYQIAKTYLDSSYDSARYFAYKGLDLAKKSGNSEASLNNYLILGFMALQTDSIIKARDYYSAAIEYTDKANNSYSILTAWLMLGYSCDLLSDNTRSMEYYFKGLHIADSLNLKTFQSNFCNNIAIIFNKTGNDLEAIKYYFRASVIYKQIDDENSYANTLLNIGGIYLNLNSIDSALFYLNKSKEINERLNNHYGLLNYYANVGEMEFEAGEYEKSLISFQHQLEEIKKLDDSFFGSKSYLRVGALLHFGDVYFELEEFEKAIENYHAVINFSRESSFLGSIVKANKGLAIVYEKIGPLDSALVYYKHFVNYSDSLNKEENIKKITELEKDYKFQKEKKLIQLEKERTEAEQRVKGLIYLSIIGASISGILFILLLFIRIKNKHKLSVLNEQSLLLENKILTNELDFKKKELTTNAIYLLKKNEFILAISSRLREMDKDIIKPKVIIDVIKELDKNTSKEVWSEFEIRFQEIHCGFYERLNEKFPNLSPNDLKLSAFLKLNMSSKDISAITYQSIATLKTARHRLRKKLGLNREENLIAFLNQV